MFLRIPLDFHYNDGIKNLLCLPSCISRRPSARVSLEPALLSYLHCLLECCCNGGYDSVSASITEISGLSEVSCNIYVNLPFLVHWIPHLLGHFECSKKSASAGPK